MLGHRAQLEEPSKTEEHKAAGKSYGNEVRKGGCKFRV